MQLSFVKIGLAVPKITLGQPLANAKEIMSLVLNDQKASILLFPELTLTGYSIGDWMFNRQLLTENLEAIQYLLDHNDDHILIVGTMLEIQHSLYNVALVIQGKQIIGVIPKQFLPRNREFSDPRFFASGRSLLASTKSINLLGQEVPIGEILFQDKKQVISFGVEVCGDMWAPVSPGALLYTKGAEVVFNLSASTFHLGKHQQRLLLAQSASLKGMGAYLYVSTGASETSSDIVYTGHKIACVNGEAILNEEKIDFSSSISYVDLDLDVIRHARMSSGWFNEYDLGDIRIVSFLLPPRKNFELEKCPRPNPFHPVRDEDAKMIIDVIGAALYKRLQYIGIKKVVIGVSGGLDSTLALLIAVKAFKTYGLDLKGIIGVTLPSFATSIESKDLALNLMNKLDITALEIPISEAVLQQFRLIGHDENHFDITFENAQARYRTLTLMNLANQNQAIVIGTSDMSEIALGWATFNGDHMAMYGLNAGLPKTTVRYLVKYLRNEFPIIREELTKISKRVISPELIPGVQATEAVVGKYEINDFILYHLLVHGASRAKIVFYLRKVFQMSKEASEKAYGYFVKRFKSQQYKRLTMPEGVKIFEVSLSPRSDVKIPGDLH
ncbi:MAG: NAD(+) synthase [Bacilli bacterium]|jgi:NAD+ synthase (glutamine-hydrolysing)|nr:NAD(+) synthase [Bacilli bacterium]HHU24617.1 NAD(+) synthase [Acholeplasmataceae bacterium]